MKEVKVGEVWIVQFDKLTLSKMEIKEVGEEYVGLYAPGIPSLTGQPHFYRKSDVNFVEKVS
jgi:hypothetical protein